ncbi:MULTISPECIES: DUF2541 family protein [Geobacter]|uniref:DUF2541 family protein n=1 Tax=Geobacter TaxID=28231 RepID=UPI0025739E9D|nr:hypothetical protein [Geobacter sulfurreducens]BEH10290.1 hypothetical protein GSUET_19020 [Geobacter sulfurreducens subsp. ethanolicus]BET58125.1 hypothetical protein GEO60473_11650 [Geobacter sp. 60473]HML78264.1 hypothetical protein [Geobacter sulfurreducens]
MYIRFLTIIALLILFSTSAWADEWVKLGDRTVRLMAERDEIPVTALKGEFKRIQIRGEESGVEFKAVVVVLANGRRINVPVRNFIPKGGKTREIDLPGKDRAIRKVVFWYKTRTGADGRARVEL